MTALLVKKLFKSILLMTPFAVMLVMVSALWGIGGKTIYSKPNPAFQTVQYSPDETKNYLLKGTQAAKPPAETLENPDATVDAIKPPAPVQDLQPEKIKWELVV